MVLWPLRAVEAATANAETLCAGRFTAADIVIGYALRLADNIGLARNFGPNVAAYWGRLQQRDGFKRAVAAERKAGVEQKRGSARSQLICSVLARSEATKQSSLSSWLHGLLRGACHRAGVRPTRWLGNDGASRVAPSPH
jgi:hypothetical protein